MPKVRVSGFAVSLDGFGAGTVRIWTTRSASAGPI